MKLSNFKLLEVENFGNFNPVRVIAEVDVTTGFIFKKTKKREICRENWFWFFTDTGKYTPGLQAEELERAFVARTRRAPL